MECRNGIVNILFWISENMILFIMNDDNFICIVFGLEYRIVDLICEGEDVD